MPACSRPEAARQHVASSMPLRRPGTPEEVAQAAAFLCSDQALFITGTILAIEGGGWRGSKPTLWALRETPRV
jgi:NAD(P)-dependent dehydrogenase (short-subunit alcohol dehydrogenase family)